MDSATLLARRYAAAFLAIFERSLVLDDIICCRSIATFLENNPAALLAIKMPALDLPTKQDLLKKLFSSCSATDAWVHLVTLLLRDHRLHLLIPVLAYIQEQFEEHIQVEECTIFSAEHLSEKQLNTIVAFIAAKTKKKVIYTHVLDQGLIAGIAIKGTSFFWEHSVRRQLRRLQKPLTLEGYYER